MFSIAKEPKWIRLSLLVLVLLFFGLNLYAALKFGPQNYLGSFETFDNDDVKYIRSAWELAENGSFIYHRYGEPTVFIMPGLSASLAAFVKIFGRFGGITAFRVFQAFLQSLSMVLIFLIGRRVFNSKAALIACVINLLSVSEYYATTMILTEVLFKFLFLLLIYVSILAVEEKRLRLYLAGGVIWALGCLVRPTIAAYPLVILVMWLVHRYKFQEIVKFTAATVLAFSLVMAPWWIRNYQVFHRFIPLTLSTGNPFLQATYINYDQTENYVFYEPAKTAIETNEIEMNVGLYRLKTFAAREPLRYLSWYTLGKSILFWVAPFYWKSMFGISLYHAVIAHWVVLGLFIAGTIRALLQKQQKFLFLLLAIAYTNLMYLPYYVMSRYSYPIMPLVGLFAGYLISEALVFGKQKLNRRQAS